MYFMGCIRVDRHSTVNVQAYKEIKRVVQQGRLVGIFPEGTRSPDGRLRRGKKGVAHLVISAGLPVIPVGMRGTIDIMSVRDRWPRLKKADIYIGTPILFENVESKHTDDNMLQIITDHIMHQIAALSGVNYIHSEDYVRKNYVI
jgi:1-acyl-sn-glycerol-3-phosphate acyltransferase